MPRHERDGKHSLERISKSRSSEPAKSGAAPWNDSALGSTLGLPSAERIDCDPSRGHLIAIFTSFGFAASAFGRFTDRTPFLKVASAFPAFTSTGSGITRRNAP